MPKYTPVTCGDGAVLAHQKSAHLAHTGSFLGLALDQSESMNTLAGVAIDSVNYLIDEHDPSTATTGSVSCFSTTRSRPFETLCHCLNFRSWMNHSIDHAAVRPLTTPLPA
jgi:hypothetical protein